MGEEYLGRVRGIEYFAALALLLELDRPFSPFYWTNVADPELPFVGLIEHANFLDPRATAAAASSTSPTTSPHGHELLSPRGRRASSPATSPACARSTRRSRATGSATAWRFTEPAAQPIVTPGYARRLPPLRTPAAGLVLANTTQVYPEDRGTNYAVRLGGDAAVAVASVA